MKQELIIRLHRQFEDFVHTDNGTEYWLARELQTLLGYDQWRNFLEVINKAQIACEANNHDISDHFAGTSKMVELGLGSRREVPDMKLTRYACYLIAQNGDPRKMEIAFAMNYFAVQTRNQEIIAERIAEWERLQAREKLTLSEKELSRLMYERGIDEKGFGRVRSKGDTALFGGVTTQGMKKRLGMPGGRALADFLPSVTIKAKDFATEVTNVQIQKRDLRSEYSVTREHIQNNRDVRKILTDREIIPENLPPAEDVQKVKRRLDSEHKKLNKASRKLN